MLVLSDVLSSMVHTTSGGAWRCQSRRVTYLVWHSRILNGIERGGGGTRSVAALVGRTIVG